MSNLNFHHIGIACNKIVNEIDYYKSLGYMQHGEIFEDPKQGVRGLFMYNNGVVIELLEPIDKRSPICSFVRNGVHMYHQGFTCEDIINESSILEEKGAIIVSPPQKSVAFGGRKVCFLMMPNQTLIELIGN